MVAMLVLALTVVVEIGTIDLGRELSWFGKLSQVQSAWVRYGLLAGSIASIICAVVYRRTRRREI
jgi:hypothetical protein